MQNIIINSQDIVVPVGKSIVFQPNSISHYKYRNNKSTYKCIFMRCSRPKENYHSLSVMGLWHKGDSIFRNSQVILNGLKYL